MQSLHMEWISVEGFRYSDQCLELNSKYYRVHYEMLRKMIDRLHNAKSANSAKNVASIQEDRGNVLGILFPIYTNIR